MQVLLDRETQLEAKLSVLQHERDMAVAEATGGRLAGQWLSWPAEVRDGQARLEGKLGKQRQELSR